MEQRQLQAGQGWQFWIDRRGTFTDIVSRRSDRVLLTHKLLRATILSNNRIVPPLGMAGDVFVIETPGGGGFGTVPGAEDARQRKPAGGHNDKVRFS